MKKAKVMLSAIAVVALVGGALAYKSNRSQTHIFSHMEQQLPLQMDQ